MEVIIKINDEKQKFFDMEKIEPDKQYLIKRVDIRKEYYRMLDKIQKEKEYHEQLIKDFKFIRNTDCEAYRQSECILEFIGRLLEKKEE